MRWGHLTYHGDELEFEPTAAEELRSEKELDEAVRPEAGDQDD